MSRGRVTAVVVVTALVALVAVVASRRDAEPATEAFELTGRPSAVAVAGGLAWVADDESDSLSTLDAGTGAPVGDPVAVSDNPVALAASGDTVWVGHADGTVVAVDVATRTPSRPRRVGDSITGLAATDEGVWATDLPRHSVVEMDAGTGRVVRRITVPRGAVRVAVAGDALWISNLERTVTRVDLATGDPGPVVPVGAGPIGLASDGETLWVTGSDDDTVSRLDAATGEEAGPAVTTGNAPVAVAVESRAVWVVNQDDRTLARVDPGTATVARYDLGTRPRGVAAGEGAVWVVGTDPPRAVRIEAA